MKKIYFTSILLFYIVSVFYLAITTPISPHEAKILYASDGIVHFFMLLGNNLNIGFLSFRIFFLFFGFLSIFLFYLLSKLYFSNSNDIYLSTIIFIFLPATLTATILANVGIIVLALVLGFVLLYEKKAYALLIVLMMLLFLVHDTSIVFFVAVFFYALNHRDKVLLRASFVFILGFIILHKGIDIGGSPKGHFVEIFGLYATVFSPLLFLYFFYAMYRILLRGEKSLLWYISFTALAFSLLLSIRQSIHITDFAPYVMISTVLMLELFYQTLRVRLPLFQKYYKRGFYIILSFLLLTFFITLGHKLFFYLENPKFHFAKRIYEPFYLAKKLKAKGVGCYDVKDLREGYILRYYGIKPCAL